MIGVFLAAYGIPVTFHTVMTVIGGNSLANTVSATPGGVGRQPGDQRRLAERRDRRDDRDGVLCRSAAHRDGLERRSSACALVVWAFGWSGGEAARRASPTPTRRTRSAEQKAQRAGEEGGEARGRGQTMSPPRATSSRDRRAAVATHPSAARAPALRSSSALVAWFCRARCSSPPGLVPGVAIEGLGGAARSRRC